MLEMDMVVKIKQFLMVINIFFDGSKSFPLKINPNARHGHGG